MPCQLGRLTFLGLGPGKRFAGPARRFNHSHTLPPYLVIVSIGNPENSYRGTRHSVGHSIVELLLKAYGCQEPFREHPKRIGIEYAVVPEERNLLFVRSQSFMNTSGGPVSRLWNAVRDLRGPQKTALVVVHDEISLAVGQVQVRKQFTSARGHNGLRSITEHLGGAYTKIGVGVGKPLKGDVADYVLTSFNKHDSQVIHTEVVPKVQALIEEMKRGRYITEVNEALEENPKKAKREAKRKLKEAALELKETTPPNPKT